MTVNRALSSKGPHHDRKRAFRCSCSHRGHATTGQIVAEPNSCQVRTIEQHVASMLRKAGAAQSRRLIGARICFRDTAKRHVWHEGPAQVMAPTLGIGGVSAGCSAEKLHRP